MNSSIQKTPLCKDVMLVLLERLARQLYWSYPILRRWLKRKRTHATPISQECTREDLLKYLGDMGMKNGVLAMVHTGIDGLKILDVHGVPAVNAIAQAQMLMEDLLNLVGPDGTLVMPTHAKYQADELESETQAMITYDPKRSPCGVGLVNSLFLRKKGVKRSLFPFNMLAAHGPLSDELLRDNLNEHRPSPHGVDSGYYRFSQLNGLVVSVGVPLRECITLGHVVEEVRTDWPIKDFFAEHNYRVMHDGAAREWRVRLRRDVYAKFCHCRKKVGRDLIAEGVIHEGLVGSVRVDWAMAADVYDFFWRKTAKWPYPYYGRWMIKKPWNHQA